MEQSSALICYKCCDSIDCVRKYPIAKVQWFENQYFTFSKVLFYFMLLSMEPRVSHTLDKCCITEPQTHPIFELEIKETVCPRHVR